MVSNLYKNWGVEMDVGKRVAKIENRIAIREARIHELKCEVEMLQKVRRKWKRVLGRVV
ncbi:unnamed protein product [marine sediment metagenome]|uniref:Uncharacterized protein n=1 Tax=marine sediment metagenome TaxID=412755 RepID=X1MC08_9ZZZZ